MKKYLKYLFLFLIFLVALLFNFSICRGDTFANYGFSYAISMGEIPYKDFNMVITPFSSFLYSIGLLINKSILVYYIEQAILLVVLACFLEKLLGKKIYLFYLFLCLIWPVSLASVIFPGYNFICFLLLIIIIYLENNKGNDYLIGILLGLIFCSKQTIGVCLFLPSFYFIIRKEYRSLFKRMGGFLIPCCILLIYLLITDSLYQFIDLCFLGLFNFGNTNSSYSWFYLLLFILGISYVIYRVFKNKNNIINYYFLMYFIVSLPIIDYYHVSLFLAGVLFLFIYNLKIDNKYYKVIVPLEGFLYLLGGAVTILYLGKPVVTMYNNFPLYLVNKKYDQNVKKLDGYLDTISYDKVFLLRGSENYMFKIMNNMKITYYDLPNHGNYGYNGEEKIIKEISNMYNKLFIVDSELCKDEEKFQQYICEFKEEAIANSKLIKTIGNYQVYYRK